MKILIPVVLSLLVMSSAADPLQEAAEQAKELVQKQSPRQTPAQGWSQSVQADLKEFYTMIEESRQESTHGPKPSLGVKFGTLNQGVFVSAVHLESRALNHPQPEKRVQPAMMLLNINGIDLTQMNREDALKLTLETIDKAEGEIRMTFMAPDIVEVVLSKESLKHYPEGFADRWEARAKKLQSEQEAYSKKIHGKSEYIPFLAEGRALLTEALALRGDIFRDISKKYKFYGPPPDKPQHRHPQQPGRRAPRPKHPHDDA